MKYSAIPAALPFAALALNLLDIQTANAVSWVTNSPLNVARYDHTATLLLNGKVLIAGGYVAGGATTASAELYDPATGSNTLTGSLLTARSHHTATLLPNGKVLVAGGILGFSALSSAELYDPASGTWTNTGSLNVARYYHTATLLPDGEVLVAGGHDAASSTAELYNPATGQWTLTPPMTTGRFLHTATLLTNGMVLVAGGEQGIIPVTYLANAELYDPAGNSWHATASMITAREGHTATLLPAGASEVAGKVLVAGGISAGSVTASSELYNPASATWISTGGMTIPRYGHTATLLPDGDVLVTGGSSVYGVTNTAELYNVTGRTYGTWSATGAMDAPRSGQTATLLPSGKVLVIGGLGLNGSVSGSVDTYYPAAPNWTVTGSTNVYYQQTILLPSGKVLAFGYTNDIYYTPIVELYNPSDNSWSAAPQTNMSLNFGTPTLLPNGKVLVTGAITYTNFVGYFGIPSAQLYDPVPGTWTNTGMMPSGLFASTATLLLNGQVLIAGGFTYVDSEPPGTEVVTNSCFLYNPATQTWSETGKMGTPRVFDSATLLPDGRVLVAGGSDGNNLLDSIELYDPASGTWTPGTHSMLESRSGHTATLLPNGQVLLAGGWGEYTYILSEAELFNPQTGTLTLTGPMNVGRTHHIATLLPNGMVLASGGTVLEGMDILGAYFGDTNGAELYDPASGRWTAAPAMTESRDSHNAILLANGKVLVSGDGDSLFAEDFAPGAELFDAGLAFSASRQPQITSIASTLNLGGSLAVSGSSFRDLSEGSAGNGSQDSPSDFPMVQLRSLANEQTVFLSSTNWSANSFVSLPVTNFPAGWAMATVFVNGIPGTSSIILIAPTPTSVILVNPLHQPDGSFQFSFTNTPGALFTALGTTNITLPASNWTVLGGATEISSGQFQFNDPQATNYLHRFYRVRSP
ncbi:MAG: kelch repeat-containing protein [Limisphaerales bacterium]